MNITIAVILGILFSTSIYLMLHRSFFKLIVGMIVFGYATVYFLFVISGITENNPPLLSEGQPVDTESMADPLPQALTLTAIVIGIGIQLFAMVLLKNVFKSRGTDDLDQLNTTDKTDPPNAKQKE